MNNPRGKKRLQVGQRQKMKPRITITHRKIIAITAMMICTMPLKKAQEILIAPQTAIRIQNSLRHFNGGMDYHLTGKAKTVVQGEITSDKTMRIVTTHSKPSLFIVQHPIKYRFIINIK
ncbi:hypothetical protein [Acetanaerobacterium elongatum]|uniref:hypothetical protein n=1 Tax=Acetanaerobacterium elongatum TaxID=258515 RepID=UPI00115F8D59|nr:hypothetical protein [Acetanaerobacterium elongatum]